MIKVISNPQDLRDLVVILSEFEHRLKSTRIKDFTGRLTKGNVLHVLRDEQRACEARLDHMDELDNLQTAERESKQVTLFDYANVSTE